MASRSVFGISLLFGCFLAVPGWGAESGSVEAFMHWFARLADDPASRLTLLLAIGLATFISEDLACIAAGLFAARGVISPAEALLASGIGIYVGDLLLYLLGYCAGGAMLRRPPLSWFVSERAIAQGRTLFARRGLALIFASRFVPGTRTATFIGAGMLRVKVVRLLAVFAAAVTIWTPVLVLASMLIGRQVIGYVDLYSTWAVWVFLLLLGLLFFLTRFVVPLFTWRGRRLLLGWWRRLTRWEFWPFYVVNTATFAYVLYLGFFRYRRPALFTVTNPGMPPDSGFLGESKAAILPRLTARAVGAWEAVPGDTAVAERRRLLGEFIDRRGLAYPIVLKPDRGERGKGVAVCRTTAEAEAWIAQAEKDYIMMEFIPGEEFGVFYYRFPEAAKGTIFSLNRKRFLHVAGDGRQTLEELILSDERAVCMAPVFMRERRDELLDIIPPGETRQLGHVGAHSRGTLFLDGSDLITEQLLEAVEAIVAPYDGFYFGRFDFKAPSEADLMAGRHLQVIELNGVTSEATHIYDPRNSITSAWHTLIEQWSIAFAIAAANERRGFEPMGLAAFLRHCWRAARR